MLLPSSKYSHVIPCVLTIRVVHTNGCVSVLWPSVSGIFIAVVFDVMADSTETNAIIVLEKAHFSFYYHFKIIQNPALAF